MSSYEIGIMQGRLAPPAPGRIQSFPTGEWREEFARAQQAGLAFIEWIYDEYGAQVNPLVSNTGIAEMQILERQTGVRAASLCADWLMDWPLLKGTPEERPGRLARLLELIMRCGQARMRYIILPFVDASKFDDDAQIDAFIALANTHILPAAHIQGLEVHLETSLPPDKIRALLAKIPDPLFRMNFDSGNSASLGYAPDEEFAAYGNRIGSIHIKDRLLGGATVPLGLGNADFESLFKNIRAVDYSGPFVLQAARGEAGDEVNLAQRNRIWLERHLEL